MNFARNFIVVLGAALASSILGGGFGALVAFISPEFVKGLFASQEGNLVRYAAAVGMIWGLFIGAAVMGFCLFLSVASQWFR